MRHLGYNLQTFCRANMRADKPFRLARLWSDWSRVVGEEVAALVRPLGHRKRTLRLGVEDGAAMQEATFHAPGILDAVNGYLGEVFFDKVQCELRMGKTPLDARGIQRAPKAPPVRPAKLGQALAFMDPESPVARGYRAYLAMFGEKA